MSYPGNRSLAPEIQNRILSTFRQTIDLAEKGRLQEARLGCEFILKMDSQFAAARQLKERLEGASGPVKAADLQIAASAPSDSATGTQAPAAPARQPASTTSRDAAAPEPATSDPVSAAPPAGARTGDRPADPGSSAPPPAAAEPFADLSEPESTDLELDLDLDDDFGLGEHFGDLDLEEPGSPSAAGPLDEEATAPAAALSGQPASAVSDDELAADPDLGSELDAEITAEVDAPAAAPPSPAAASGNPRIDELLAEGQAAFDRGEYQGAIDAWSRIFLIDIDHEEAGSRIEEARRLKAERERQGDEQLSDAKRARDEGRLDEARTRLEGLLAEQPQNLAARELLDQIQAAEEDATAAPLPTATAEPAEAAAPRDDATPAPAARSAGPAPAPALPGGAGRARGGSRSPYLLGGAVFLLVVVGAWFLWSNWGSLFPNAVVEQPAAPTAPQRPSPLRRANQLRLDGDLPAAVQVLEGIAADHPEAAQAKTLLDQIQAEIAARSAEEQAAAEAEASRQASRERLLEEARRAYDERHYLEAAKAFRAADELAKLEGTAADLYRDTREQLLPIAQQIDLFRQREWEQVLPTLWRKLEDDPQNRDVRQILTDSYYNLAIRDLRRGDAESAAESLEEVVALDGDDALAERLHLFATSYSERQVDLLYRIFVGQLEFRR